MTATTTTTAPKPAGLYTVPLGSNEPLRKGVAKLQFKVTSPIMATFADFVLNRVKGQWDSKLVPAALAALRVKGVTNIRFPSGNFYVDKAGNLKSASVITSATAKAKGYAYCPRKGFDKKTGIGFFWVVVS